jgi:hypothetical protein
MASSEKYNAQMLRFLANFPPTATALIRFNEAEQRYLRDKQSKDKDQRRAAKIAWHSECNIFRDAIRADKEAKAIAFLKSGGIL